MCSTSKSARSCWFFILLAAVLVGIPAPQGHAQYESQSPSAITDGADAGATSGGQANEERLPETRTTAHELALPDRTLGFEATAGAITVTDAGGDPEAEIGYVAYVRPDADPGMRPVTFAVNGGPGAASAYLHLGVLGPWYLPMGSESIIPSQNVDLIPNTETWLDFTDLVFIDPVGTGFSRLIEPSDRRRKRYYSIEGDIEALAEFVRRWLTDNRRIGSPKYFVGESYGGFRGPLLAEALQTDYGLALNGMVLLSPVLDFAWWNEGDFAPLSAVSLLPSFAAAAMEERNALSETALRDAEAYAESDYLADLLKGPGDAKAVERIVDRVTELTGLDRAFVERTTGRIGRDDFARELLRDEGRLASAYDTMIASDDPSPGDARPWAADPVLDAMTAPLTSAMLQLYGERLDWLPERRYHLLNGRVNRAWDWGGGRRQPETMSELARVLALDPEFRLLVVHGYTDLVTPYFGNELLLRQLPATIGNRARTANYRGGHMFYLRKDSRQAFREDAKAVYGSEGD